MKPSGRSSSRLASHASFHHLAFPARACQGQTVVRPLANTHSLQPDELLHLSAHAHHGWVQSRNPCCLRRVAMAVVRARRRMKNACGCRLQANQEAIARARWELGGQSRPRIRTQAGSTAQRMPNPNPRLNAHLTLPHAATGSPTSPHFTSSACLAPGLVSQPTLTTARTPLPKVRLLYMWRLNPYILLSAGPGHHAALHRALALVPPAWSPQDSRSWLADVDSHSRPQPTAQHLCLRLACCLPKPKTGCGD